MRITSCVAVLVQVMRGNKAQPPCQQPAAQFVGVLGGSALQSSEFSHGVNCSSMVLSVTLTSKSTLASECLQLGRHWELNWLLSVIK